MKQIYLLLITLLCFTFSSNAQNVELPVDFESATLVYDFIGFEGADSAIEGNPDATGVNTSDTVLRSEKTMGAQFFAGTFLNLDTPIDFSASSSIEIDTYSPKADIPVRIALENQTTGNQIFVDVDTSVIDTWETLTADFSGLINPAIDYNRIVVFFEFIVDLPGDGSIYYFDNIQLGTPPPPTIQLPLDFELDPMSYTFVGFEGADSAIEGNPDATGVNTTANVMRSTKTMGAQFFAGTFVNLDTPIDFSSTSSIDIDTYSPKADIPVRIALENQTTGNQIFVDVDTSVIDTWETLSADFSALINPMIEYDRIIVFFEFIVDLPGDGSIYYFDNVRLGTPPPTAIQLPLDFELDPTTYTFSAFGGTDSAIEGNPDATGVNTTANVMRSTKTMGAQFFAGTFVDLDTPIDFSSSGIIEIDTYSPKADIPVRIALENQTTSNQIFVDVDTSVINTWETLTADFSALIDPMIEYDRIVIIFEFIVDLPGDDSIYYFDNARLGTPTSPTIQLPLDFELDPTAYTFVGFEGADSAIEGNPDATGVNTTANVMRSTKTMGAQFFAGTFVNLDTPIDFSSTSSIDIDTYSPKADIPVRIALENQTTGNQIFVDVDTSVIDTWETLTADFSGLIDPMIEYNRIIVFFEFIVDLPGDGSIYYFDNARLSIPSTPTIQLPLDFELDPMSYTFVGFEGADSAIEGNPDATGVNTTANVMRSTKTMGAQFFAGTFVDLDTPIDFSTNQGISIDTYSPKADIPVRIALENQTTGNQIFVDVDTSVIDTWETLTADFSALINPMIEYDRIIVFFEFIVDLPGDGSIYYFDNARTADVSGGIDIDLPLDFELDPMAYTFIGFEGADSAIEGNPDATGVNTTANVMRSTKTMGAQFFAGTFVNLDIPIDFSSTGILEIDTYSPKADIPIRVALENQATGNQIFVDVNTTVVDTWETLSFDFSALINPSIDYNRIVVFFEFIVDLPGDGSIYYFDNARLGTPPDLCMGETTYTMSGWDNGVPDASTRAIIAADYTTGNLGLGSITACELIVNTGVTLTVSNSSFVSVENNITVNGILNVSNSGSLVQVSPDAITTNNGTIAVTKTTPSLEPRDFILLSSPMSGETRGGVYLNADRVFGIISNNFIPNADVSTAFPMAANFIDDNGDYLDNAITSLNPSTGYLVFPQAITASGAITFDHTYTQGTLNSGDIAAAITYNGVTENNFNLLGNPYASAIDTDALITGNAAMNEAYFWEHITAPNESLPGFGNANFSMDDVSVRNLMMGVAAVNDMSGTAPGQFMASGQGFAILADQTAASSDVTFTNAMRVTTNNGTPNFTEQENRLWLRLDSETYTIQSTTGIGFVPEATSGFDVSYDSPQIATTVSLFSTLDSGERLVIQGREVFNSEMEINLGFQTLISETEQYTISIGQLQGVDLQSNDIFLMDNLLNIVTNLKETAYTFASSETVQDDRFTLMFRAPLLTIDDNSLANEISLYPNPTQDIVTLAYTGSSELQELVIADIQGKVIKRIDLGTFEQQQTFTVSDLKTGIYFFSVRSAQSVQSFKMIKK